MICAPTCSESNSKISEVEFLLVDFFPFISLALASCGRFASADHLTVYFLIYRSACVNGRDVRELDDLFVVLLLVYREPSS